MRYEPGTSYINVAFSVVTGSPTAKSQSTVVILSPDESKERFSKITGEPTYVQS
jgi:hypothetical protein